MPKRLVIYNIADENTRAAFGDEIDKISTASISIVPDNCTVFVSDLNLHDLYKIPLKVGVDTDDHVIYFLVDGEIGGFGVEEEMVQFMRDN